GQRLRPAKLRAGTGRGPGSCGRVPLVMKGGGKRQRTTTRAGGKQSVGKQNGEKRPAARAAAAAQEPGHPTVELARQLAAIVETHALTELVMDTPDLTLTFRRGQESGVWGGATVATSVPAAMPM